MFQKLEFSQSAFIFCIKDVSTSHFIDFSLPLLEIQIVQEEFLFQTVVKSALRERTSIMLKWLDTVFQGQYLPSLSINYAVINKDLEKLPPQFY